MVHMFAWSSSSYSQLYSRLRKLPDLEPDNDLPQFDKAWRKVDDPPNGNLWLPLHNLSSPVVMSSNGDVACQLPLQLSDYISYVGSRFWNYERPRGGAAPQRPRSTLTPVRQRVNRDERAVKLRSVLQPSEEVTDELFVENYKGPQAGLHLLEERHPVEFRDNPRELWASRTSVPDS
ncbi:hypothetical protein EVAR_32885_1 [Eumeta japonica]|uniref:Uncharacterized protein n=1 Tax=Eumeta variegata TaxID=151549 RepID=A0A4C1VTB9_EUMVA|nr:hypothetical protein EVAR_32885_1 [Eumeta japonica]